MADPRRMTERAHGVYAKYKLEGCRCTECCWANAVYYEALIKRKRQGPILIDAGKARDHARRLQAQGMGLRRICTLSGVSRSGMQKLMGISWKPSARIRPDTEARILAVVADLAPSALIDAAPTWRRLQALIVDGHPKTQIAQALDIGIALQIRDGLVLRSTAEKVSALYAAWENTPGTSSRARNYGLARGWLLPGDWADIDAGLTYAALERQLDEQQAGAA